MKKAFFITITFWCIVYGFFACNDYKTFEELKSEEKVVIRRIIAEKGISVLSEYPADGVFAENEYVELESGIYLNVVDSGCGDRAVANLTYVLVRASGYVYDADTPYYFSTFANNSYPFEFKYGQAYSVANQHYASYDAYYYYFGMGIESILNYVGDSAVVKLIVPGYSEISDYRAGSTYQSSNSNQYYTIFFDKVRYIYYK
jgi:hypothetical protein